MCPRDPCSAYALQQGVPKSTGRHRQQGRARSARQPTGCEAKHDLLFARARETDRARPDNPFPHRQRSLGGPGVRRRPTVRIRPKRSGYAARLARTLLVASGSLGGTLASPRRESGLSGAASANPRIAHVAKVPRRHHAASGEIGEKWRKATRRCAREEFKNLGSRSEPQPEMATSRQVVFEAERVILA
jgi:hypothetical protein